MTVPDTLDAGTIVLDEVESTLSKLLLDVGDFIEKNPPPPENEESQVSLPDELAKAPLELRFTGGWVRDKLLGVTSHDIDVAINKMTGYQFGLRLKEYLEIPGNAEKYGLGHVDKKAGSLSKIAANPEKSKHLETVTTKILGLDIDLVNLRKETYTEDSRNPQIEFGTPEEDALRRDATINAMFYNITTSVIEDFTKRGFQDLKSEIIRTPLEPYTTFKDDPLRVLRLIRFSSRLNYKIDEEARKAMGDKGIKEALKLKITKERIWTEFEKMLKGPDPHMALQLIDELDLYHTIFVDPESKSSYTPDTQNCAVAYNALDAIIKSSTGARSMVHSTLIRNEEDKFLSWILASMVPWADAPEPAPLKNGRIPPPMASNVVTGAFKAPNQIINLLTPCVHHLSEIRDLKDRQETSRDTLGMAIRKWGASWRLQVAYAMLYEIFTSPGVEDGIISSYSTFLATIKEKNLLEAYSFKPLIDGTTLAKALSTSPGTWMRPALDMVMAWQLRNPDITDPAAAIEEVRASDIANATSGSKMKGKKSGNAGKGEHVAKKQKKGELTSALITHFLRQTLKPIFSKTQTNPEITLTARRKMGDSSLRKSGVQDMFDEESSKPWKFKDAWALDLLTWVCRSLDQVIVEREWGYLIPPILTVVDDTDVKIRAKGCNLLKYLFEATTPIQLARTGLAPLFEESLYVSTTYLPTLTPDEDSVQILVAAIPALLELVRCAHPRVPTPSMDSAKHTERIKALDKIMRKGLLFPYSHAGEHVRVAEVLISYLPAVLGEIGVDAVKHLKDLVPLLANVLAEPFGLAYPPLLLNAAKAMQALILNAWPRVPFWRVEILRGVSICWIRMEEEQESISDSEEGHEVRNELKTAVGMLKAALQNEEHVNWDEEVAELVKADDRLKGLFGD